MLKETEKQWEEFRDKFFLKISKTLGSRDYLQVCYEWDKVCDEIFSSSK